MRATHGEAGHPRVEAGAGRDAGAGHLSSEADGQPPGPVNEEARAASAKQAAERVLTGISSPQALSPASGRVGRHANDRVRSSGPPPENALNCNSAMGAAGGPSGLPATPEPAAALQDRTSGNAAAVGARQKSEGARRRAPPRRSPQKENGGAGIPRSKVRAPGDGAQPERCEPSGPHAPAAASGSNREPLHLPSQPTQGRVTGSADPGQAAPEQGGGLYPPGQPIAAGGAGLAPSAAGESAASAPAAAKKKRRKKKLAAAHTAGDGAAAQAAGGASTGEARSTDGRQSGTPAEPGDLVEEPSSEQASELPAALQSAPPQQLPGAGGEAGGTASKATDPHSHILSASGASPPSGQAVDRGASDPDSAGPNSDTTPADGGQAADLGGSESSRNSAGTTEKEVAAGSGSTGCGGEAGRGHTTMGREVAWEGLAGLGVRWGVARERKVGEDASCQHAANTWAHAGLAGECPTAACSPLCALVFVQVLGACWSC